MLFEDYSKTRLLYHVISLKELGKALKEGLKCCGATDGRGRHQQLHRYIDGNKPEEMPDWVSREQGIFASFNFKDNHEWHSHSAILSIKADPAKCWVCNENIANTLYEPIMLQLVPGFESAAAFLERHGEGIVRDYWMNSLPFEYNLELRRDFEKGYDAEVLVMHDIPASDIECLYIASDHRILTIDEWQNYFKSGSVDYARC